jgi:hypothetical protein
MLDNVNEAINKFRSYVIQQSRSNLTKGNKNVSKSLYNSLKSELVKDGNYTLVGFSMDKYGMFQDKGVKGAKSASKAPNSPYKYTNKMPPIKPLSDWAKKKNIRLRDASGKFEKGNYKTIGFLIARSIFEKGIKPSLFFTKPFEAGYKKFIDTDLMVAFSQDVDTILSETK